MKKLHLSFFWLLIFSLFWLSGCTGGSIRDQFEKPYFDLPPDQISSADKDLFERALFRQKNNRIQAANKVWNQFLRKHPRSFEAHNNLGLVYYEDDQLDPAIAEFETARSLEPSDLKIKKNLVRVLKFKSTLLRESRDYNAAVSYLRRAQEYSPLREKEKIGFLIEELEDRVYEQVKTTDTLEAYENFLEKYPDSPKNSDDARRKIEGLKPRENAVSPIESLEKRSEVQELFPASVRGMDEGADVLEKTSMEVMQQPEEMLATAESMRIDPLTAKGVALQETDKMSMGALAESEAIFGRAEPVNIEALADNETAMQDAPKMNARAKLPEPKMSMPSAKKNSFPEKPTEVARSPEQFIEFGTQPEPKPSTGTRLLNATSGDSRAFPEFSVSSVTQQVRVVTRSNPLRVRAAPFIKSRVITTLEKGALIPLIKEVGGWYKVEFTQGRAGWISKKFAEVVK